VLAQARQHLQGFLLRHERIYRGPRAWTLAYRRWLTTVRSDHPAQQIVLQDYIHAVEAAEARRDRLTRQIDELLSSWSMAPVVKALQAMRGVALVVAVTVVPEVGDFRRFANARQLMAYLGLVPSEHSSGSTTRRGGITKAGNALARRVLIEGAWAYRMKARVSPSCTTVSSRYPWRFAILHGRRRCGCVRGTAGWLHWASPASWPPPRSPAKWSALSGQLPASPSQRSKTSALSRPAKRRDADSGRKALWICRCAWTTLRVAHNSTGPTSTVEAKRRNLANHPIVRIAGDRAAVGFRDALRWSAPQSL
jgi:hypothetical protein